MIPDLQYPEDARRVIDFLHKGLQYDAAIAVLGLGRNQLGELPDLSTGIKYGNREADEAVRRDAPGLLSRFSLISMVSRIERHAQLLLLQRRVIEELGTTGEKMRPEAMWKILRRVHTEARGGPVKLCSELVVTKPSSALIERMAWLEGIIKVRNCLAHRLGQVSLEDVKPSGVPLEATKDTDTLKVVWLRLKTFINGKEIETFPHPGGGRLECLFAEYQREWKIGDQIEVTPAECQAIGMTLSFLGNQLLVDFEAEINSFLAGGLSR
jgi:hypothetical protein